MTNKEQVREKIADYLRTHTREGDCPCKEHQQQIKDIAQAIIIILEDAGYRLPTLDVEKLTRLFALPSGSSDLEFAYNKGASDQFTHTKQQITGNDGGKIEMAQPCSYCGSTNTGESPTGYWCNKCGFQDPCECWQKGKICAWHKKYGRNGEFFPRPEKPEER